MRHDIEAGRKEGGFKVKTKWLWFAVAALLVIGARPLFAHEGEDHDEAAERVTTGQTARAEEEVRAAVPLGLQGLKEMISVHPLFVHFPIALLCMSAIFYWLGAVLKNEGLIESGRWTLYGGVLFGVISVITGLKAANTIPHDDETHEIMELHQNMGYVIVFLSVALGAWTLAVKSALPQKGRTLFLIACLILAALVTQQADLGGRMVFLKGAGVGKKSMLRESGHSHSHGTHDHPSSS